MSSRVCSIIASVLVSSVLFSQEGLKPLSSNLNYIYRNLKPGTEKIETINNSQQKPAAAVSFTLPFIEDFYYSPTSNYPDQNKWEDSLVYVNSGMATAPPSIGVATFDGLNKNGYPYNPTLTNLTLSYPADKLTSKPINLYTSGAQTLTPGADVALSFYYQARGKGDNPEVSDSLVVDFYKPLLKPDSVGKPDTAWKSVWYKPGNLSSNVNDSAFKRAFIRITDTAYFHDGFRFRFRNWASVTGNFDHWHVDYIYLDKNRGDSLFDTVRNDLSFGDIPTPFLQDYSEMPLQQYAAFEMAPKINTKIRQNSGTQINMSYKYTVYDQHYNQVISSYNGGFANLNPFWPNTFTPPHHGYSDYAPHANPPVQFSFTPNSINGAEFPIKHFVFLNGSTTADFISGNDTVLQYQRFRNFYAFDDGSAEAGYYVNSAQAQIAVKIRLNSQDSLTGVRIYFDPVGNVSSISNTNTSVYNFTMFVWAANSNGTPSQNIIYRDSIRYNPSYLQTGFKEVPEFKLKHPVILPPGTYYIGIKQAASVLTIGYDRNYNHQTSLYYDSGNGWVQSTEKGSIMMQPVFSHYRAIVGIGENSSPEKNSFLIYPNPTSDQFTIRSSGLENTSYQLFNSLGQVMDAGKIDTIEHSVSTTNLTAGIYILILKNNGRAVQQQKIIVQH